MSIKLGGDSFHDECAVVGIIGVPEAAKFAYLALYALQHRGQEGAGIVSADAKEVYVYRDMGLVAEVFTPEVLEGLLGSLAVGHTRYATFGSKDRQNLQPFLANAGDDFLVVAHNGNLINAVELRAELEAQGALFASTSDTEVILHLAARENRALGWSDRLAKALERVQGAYSLVIATKGRMFAVRGPNAVRPLSLGKIGSGYIAASETCAFDLVGAEFVRDIEPGEILEITEAGELKSNLSMQVAAKSRGENPAFCVFEYIYFSRPDSNIDGVNVYQARKSFGEELAKDHPVVADIVIPVPDSGVPAAIGYAAASGLPCEFGLIRNHYIGRTFIEPQQSIRDFGVKVKLNANASVLRGKRVVVVDDSVVRGTTCKKIVKMLRSAGALEVHFRISSPPTKGPCYYGIDTPSYGELIASKYSVEEIRQFIGADSLGYLSSEGMYRALDRNPRGFCDACFTGNYRLGTPSANPGEAGKGCGALGQSGK